MIWIFFDSSDHLPSHDIISRHIYIALSNRLLINKKTNNFVRLLYDYAFLYFLNICFLSKNRLMNINAIEVMIKVITANVVL